MPYKLGKQVSPICNRPTGSLPPQRAVGYLFYIDIRKTFISRRINFYHVQERRA